MFGGTTLVLVAGAIAGAIRERGSSRSDQMAELHERLDFAERLLAQGRERTVLKSENR